VQPVPEVTASFDRPTPTASSPRENGMICFLNLAKMFKDQEALAA
jgi:purine-binding chemotaxis protein CheW